MIDTGPTANWEKVENGLHYICTKCRCYVPTKDCPHCAANHVRWWQDWHWRFSYGPDFVRFAPGWRVLHVGLIKLIRDVPENMRIGKGDYRGFMFTVRFFLPWEFGQ